MSDVGVTVESDLIRNLKLAIAGPRRSGAGLLRRITRQMQMQKTMSKKYRDRDGNVYGVEKASNGNWIVVRVNSGGNRKGCRQFSPALSFEAMQCTLDKMAKSNHWPEVPS